MNSYTSQSLGSAPNTILHTESLFFSIWSKTPAQKGLSKNIVNLSVIFSITVPPQ